MQFLENEWNEPSRTDHYLMQVALEAFYSNRKRPKDADINNWKIPFKFSREDGREPPADMTKEKAAAWAKAKWFGVVGVTRDVIKRAIGGKADE